MQRNSLGFGIYKSREDISMQTAPSYKGELIMHIIYLVTQSDENKTLFVRTPQHILDTSYFRHIISAPNRTQWAHGLIILFSSP